MRAATTIDAQIGHREDDLPAGRARARGWRRFLVPSLSDLFFIAFIVWLFIAGGAGWDMLLMDGDTGWHIRAGDYILDNGAIPKTDLFSFTKPDAEWYPWEWLADIVLALAHRAMGLKGVVLLAGVLVAGFGVLLLRFIIWKGANTLLGVLVAFLALGASQIHYLARPHLFTFLALVCAVWLLDRDRREPTAWVWLMVPLTAVWANLHAGFLALFPLLGLLAVGAALETLLRSPRPSDWWRPSLRYGILAAACGAASLANPFGWELHRHIASFLRQDWVRNTVMEYQAPTFRHENEFHFELLLFLGLLAAASLVSRKRVVEPLWILFWAHFSLTSMRHIPIFAVVAAPVVAVEATHLWARLAHQSPRRSVASAVERLASDLAPGFRRFSLWPVVFVLALVLSPVSSGWPSDFPRELIPTPLIARNAELFPSARVFAHDAWADYLLYRFYPRQKVFADGRSDFYGEQLIGELESAYNARANWREILDRYGCEVVLVPPDSPLASLLREHPDWILRDEDSQAVLFVRR